MKKKKYYRTKSIGLATIINYFQEPIRIEDQMFVFENTDELQNTIRDYKEGKTMVEPRLFLEV